ncbi:MAG: hypothetical protein RSC10_02755 [Longicatena sp.]
MKIYIHTKDTKLFIPIPNALVFNKMIQKGLALTLRKQTEITFNKEQLILIEKLFKLMRKDYKGLLLVDIETVDGEIVKIQI